jgi:hypothetical protein
VAAKKSDVEEAIGMVSDATSQQYELLGIRTKADVKIGSHTSNTWSLTMTNIASIVVAEDGDNVFVTDTLGLKYVIPRSNIASFNYRPVRKV